VNRNVYIFIGPPGSGKGTLSKICVEKFGWKQLSTGDLLRRHISEGTPIGKQIDFAIKSGKLVSDELITQIVYEWLKELPDDGKAVILDGFPRTVVQAGDFARIMRDEFPNEGIKVVYFEIPDAEVVARLSSRYTCQNRDCQAIYSIRPGSTCAPQQDMVCDLCGSPLGRRKDDSEEAVKERLKIYHSHEGPLLAFYHQAKDIPVLVCNADQSIDRVFEEFKKLIDIQEL